MTTPLKPVLTIGPAGHKGMTNEQMQEASRQMGQEAASHGFDFEAQFIHADFPWEEERQLIEILKSKPWAIVAIGSGLRLLEENTRLLETIINCVLVRAQPTPKLAFPTLPIEMIPTFERLVTVQKDG